MPRSLTTERLLLRPWTEADAPAYRGLWLERDPRSLRLIGPDGRPHVEDLRRAIREQFAASVADGYGLFAVEERAGGRFVGYCGLVRRVATPDEPELAYELARAFHGRGYATEAARAVRDAAATTGRTRLWAGVRVSNTASLRVLDKLGFAASGPAAPDPARGDLVQLSCRLGAVR